MGYKWEACRDTTGRHTDNSSLSSGLRGAPKALQYQLEAYCNLNWICIVVLFREATKVPPTTRFAMGPFKSPLLYLHIYIYIYGMNRWNTVSRVLFRKRDLTEHSVSSLWRANNSLRGTQ